VPGIDPEAPARDGGCPIDLPAINFTCSQTAEQLCIARLEGKTMTQIFKDTSPLTQGAQDHGTIREVQTRIRRDCYRPADRIECVAGSTRLKEKNSQQMQCVGGCGRKTKYSSITLLRDVDATTTMQILEHMKIRNGRHQG
jgi:hypothetical protein